MEKGGCLIIAIFICLFASSSCRELEVNEKHLHNRHHQLATYNHTLARILVQYASAVYISDFAKLFACTCSRCDGLIKDFEVIDLVVDVKRCLQGFVGVATDLNATVIAFRGIQESSIQNWVEDLFWKQLDIDYPGVDGAMFLYCLLQLITSAWSSKWSSESKGVIWRHQDYGNWALDGRGAMAAFCGLDLSLSLGEKNAEVMTFGQPRIGNAAFASYYNKIVPNIIHVIHEHDIVPHLPPYYYYFPQKTYHHFPREVWLHSIGFGSLIYTVEKVCDDSGEDATCSRSVSGNSISDHLTYYGVQMGCDKSCSCKIFTDPRLITYAKTGLDGNLILSRDPSTFSLKLHTDKSRSWLGLDSN